MEDIECWIKENHPPGMGARKIDKEAIAAGMKRNPDASPEELRQLLMAPDHNLGDIVTPTDEEED